MQALYGTGYGNRRDVRRGRISLKNKARRAAGNARLHN